MKILLAILGLSVITIAVVVVAMWWRLRRHLRKSDKALKETLAEIQPEHETVE